VLEQRLARTGNIAITSGSVVAANDEALAVVNVGERVYIKAAFTTRGLPADASYVVSFTVNGLTRHTGQLKFLPPLSLHRALPRGARGGQDAVGPPLRQLGRHRALPER
jgi:hypothetical protein